MHAVVSALSLAPGAMGGTETYLRGLLGGIHEVTYRGDLRVTVLAGPRGAASLRDLARGPVALRRMNAAIPGGGPARGAGLLGAMALPLPLPSDVVHYPLTVPAPAPWGTPAVVSLHDVAHLDLPRTFPAAERRYRTLAYDRAARRATMVMTGAEHARERIVERLGIAPERIVVIPHGIDHGRFRPAGGREGDGPAAGDGGTGRLAGRGAGAPDIGGPGGDAARGEGGRGAGGPDADAALLRGLALPRGPFVFYPAALWPHKNHARLLEAMSRLRGIDLVLTGATFGRPAPSAEHVHHLGHVPAAALPALYRRARALVFPSLYEGFGLPVLEAMACGCPVAVSHHGAMAEVAGDAALRFDPTDVDAIAGAIARIADDDAVRGELRAAGLARAATYTWRAAAAAHLALYADVARGAAAPRAAITDAR